MWHATPATPRDALRHPARQKRDTVQATFVRRTQDTPRHAATRRDFSATPGDSGATAGRVRAEVAVAHSELTVVLTDLRLPITGSPTPPQPRYLILS